MLTLTLISLLALAAPPETAPDDEAAEAPPSLPLVAYLDEVCATLPEEACAPLYAVIETLRVALGFHGAEWCCASCGPGQGKVACSGCRDKGAWRCGSVRHSHRTVLAACVEPYTLDEGTGALNCY